MAATDAPDSFVSPEPLPSPAAELDGGDMDCGSGLLLMLTGAMRRLEQGQVLVLATGERSVLVDLPVWARLAGHELLAIEGEGPWRLHVRRTSRGSESAADPRSSARAGPASAQEPSSLAEVLSTGEAAELGSRLWLYTNFHCNLACTYCCAQSSPGADARLLPVGLSALAVEEFVELGGVEVLLTGGEPFLHPRLDVIVGHASALVPVTILTNAMVFGRGRRRETLESMDRGRVALQVSLDSAGPQLHDAQRGAGSHAKALDGIALARSLGFRVRVSATLHEHDLAAAGPLHVKLDDMGIPAADRLVRPVAHEGYADNGTHISLETTAPEPTLTTEGIWWHPVAVTNEGLRVSKEPLPLVDSYAVIREILGVQAASQATGRQVFRCT